MRSATVGRIAIAALVFLVSAPPAFAAAPAEDEASEESRPGEEEPPRSREGETSRPGEEQGKTGEVSAPPPAPLYHPPSRGKPRARVAGGVRGVDRIWPSVFALVPAHIGRTIAEQPSLFWYVDSAPAAGTTVVFTIIDESSVDPLVETELPRPEGGGIQTVDLAELGVSLGRGIEYQWSVALVMDPEQRARDIVAVGWIERVDAPEGLPADPDAVAYAEQGLWYDALAAAQQRVRAQRSPRARRVRDALLGEVGLRAATSEGG